MTRYLSFSELMEKIGKRSRATIYRDVSKGRLPQPVKLGHRLYWPECEVEAAIKAQRIGDRNLRSTKPN